MRSQDWDRIAELSGDFLRELGVLLVTFGLLDPFLDWVLHGEAGERAAISGALIIGAGVFAFVIGVTIEIRRLRNLDVAPEE